MRLKITHITVGMCHEVCFVCSSAEEDYFRKVMQALEAEHALKSCLYVYDRDPLSGEVKRRLLHGYFVLFAITPSVIRRALDDENDAFRRVYGYVNRVNQSAISLMSVGGSEYDNHAEYPKEMKSMYWLHRKQIRTGYFSPNLIAAELYSELRRHHSRRDNLHLEKQAKQGVMLYRSMYRTMFAWTRVAFLCLLAFVVQWVFFLYHPENNPWYLNVLKTVFTVAGYIAVPLVGILPFVSLNKRDELLDVSTVFKDFKRLTMRRLCILGGLLCAAWLVFILTNATSLKSLEGNLSSAVYQWENILCATAFAPTAVYFLKTAVFCRKLKKLPTDGAGFLRFAEWRWKAHIVFGVLMAVGSLLASQLYRFFV